MGSLEQHGCRFEGAITGALGRGATFLAARVEVGSAVTAEWAIGGKLVVEGTLNHKVRTVQEEVSVEELT